jgi:UDP-N-acetylglucosamine transferase subunit ALG13
MIFVTVGTSNFSFERLLRRIDELELREELVVQYGASPFVPRAKLAEQFMSYDEVADNMRKARVAVVHGGAGSILTAFYAKVRPIVVPRRPEYGEVVDDHQVELAQRLARAGVVTLVENVDDLTPALLADADVSEGVPAESALAGEIAAFVRSTLAVATR